MRRRTTVVALLTGLRAGLAGWAAVCDDNERTAVAGLVELAPAAVRCAHPNEVHAINVEGILRATGADVLVIRPGAA